LLLRSRKALIVATLVVGIVTVVGTSFAFTASNTVPNASLGQGSNTISGYTVSSVVYTQNGTTPSNIDQVAFTLSPTAAGTVKVQLASGGAWYACSNSSGSVTCDTTSPQADAGSADALSVVAGA
jgi:hypothetical protein